MLPSDFYTLSLWWSEKQITKRVLPCMQAVLKQLREGVGHVEVVAIT